MQAVCLYRVLHPKTTFQKKIAYDLIKRYLEKRMVIFSLFPYNSERFLHREFEQALWPQTGNDVGGRTRKTLPVSFSQ